MTTPYATTHAALHRATAEFAGLTQLQQDLVTRDALNIMQAESVGIDDAIRSLLGRLGAETLESYARTLDPYRVALSAAIHTPRCAHEPDPRSARPTTPAAPTSASSPDTRRETP